MVKQQEKKETMAELFKRNGATISISLRDGFANIEIEEQGKMTVTFLNDEGFANEEGQISAEDIGKVADFVRDLKSMRLEDYKK